MNVEQKYTQACCCILEECTEMLSRIDSKQTEQFIEMLCGARRVFFIGVGRVMLSLEAMAKRLAHLGIETHVVGDINEPAFGVEDLLVVASGSGESIVPVAIAKKAKSIGARSSISAPIPWVPWPSLQICRFGSLPRPSWPCRMNLFPDRP